MSSPVSTGLQIPRQQRQIISAQHKATVEPEMASNKLEPVLPWRDPDDVLCPLTKVGGNLSRPHPVMQSSGWQSSKSELAMKV